MAKINTTENWEFETKQLHIGQGSRTRQQIQEQFRFIRLLLMYSETLSMLLQDLVLPMQGTYMED